MIGNGIYAFLSSLERIVHNWLTRNNLVFATQEKMFGGSMELGSAIIDFILTERAIALRVMGSYWHSGLEAEARDLLGKEKLNEAGYIVVDLWEDDLTKRLEHTMREAILGRGLPR